MRISELIIPTTREGLVLRELDVRDDEAFFESILASREHLAQFGKWAINRYRSLGQVAMARCEQSERRLRLGIWEGGSFAGNINAQHDRNGWAEIGSIWIDADHVGRGIGTLAVQAVRDYLLGIGVTKIVADARAANEAAVKMLTRNGFAPDPDPGPSFAPADYDAYKYEVEANP